MLYIFAFQRGTRVLLDDYRMTSFGRPRVPMRLVILESELIAPLKLLIHQLCLAQALRFVFLKAASCYDVFLAFSVIKVSVVHAEICLAASLGIVRSRPFVAGTEP